MVVTGKFTILIDGKLKTYTNYNDIPSSFDNLISFEPDIPPPPHEGVEHEQIHEIGKLLTELMQRETK